MALCRCLPLPAPTLKGSIAGGPIVEKRDQFIGEAGSVKLDS